MSNDSNVHSAVSVPPTGTIPPRSIPPQRPEPAGPESEGFTTSLLGVINCVRKHWLLSGAVFALVMGLTVFVTLGTTPIYEAKATVLFDPAVARPLGEQVQAVVTSDSSSYLSNKEYYKTQQWTIQSMRTVGDVVRQLGLDKDPTFLEPETRQHAQNVTVAASQLLLERLSVDAIRDSRLMSVSYRDPNPQRAQRVLSVLLDSYVQQNLDDVSASTTAAADWLREQTTALRDVLEKSERALHDYRKDKNILSISLDDQSNMLRGEMQQLNQALTEVKTRREKVASRVQALKEIAANDPENLPALELIDSPVLQKFREEFVVARRLELALLGQGKSENHPEVKAAAAVSATSREALLAEVRNILSAHERELSSLERELTGLSKLYRAAEKRALDLNLLEIEFNRLRRNKENNEKLFSLVIERSKETDLTRMLKVNNIRVVDRPLLPEEPVSPNVLMNLAAGLAGGLLFGLIAAIGRERLDRSIKVPDDVEHELGLSFLGLLPQIDAQDANSNKSRRRGRRKSQADPIKHPELAVAMRPSSGVAEAARAVRTNIVFMSPDRPFRTLLVTSAGPSEGKTTVACALATTMAQAGQRVLLVDCDLRRPRIHRVFGASNDEGVTSAVVESKDRVPLPSRSTEVPNLWILPSGPLPPNPAELLQSDAFQRTLDRMKDEFDRVIIDSPPIVPVTDATVLSTRVDGTILVVRAGVTTREFARRAVRSLRDVGGHNVGVVLNAVDLESRYSGYYHYYYYRREGYGSDRELTESSNAAAS
jgi:succinoglycan biosynthesis transport protein ExoP